MSIFKVKHLWSNDTLQSEEYEDGIQNSGCIKVDKFNSHNDSDCIIVAEERQLKIYKPDLEFHKSHILLESHFTEAILQIETGKFVFDSNDRQIILLHPQSYGIYFLEKKEGHTDAGDQNYIKPVIKHSFTRKALNILVGPFGNTKSRDLICIQSLDGTITFFDQDSFLFMCIFDDIILPGPISYVASSDLFVICKSTWILEVYTYRQLAEFSELSGRQNKKQIPQWTYSPGEEISAVQIIRTSSNFSSIIAMGERYLYCFQDNGLMKYMIRFDYMPICFHAYLVGLYYEPNSRLLVMVASEDSKLYIYEGTQMLWSCDLLQKPISVLRCFIKNLPGGLVTLSTNGIVNVSYLGTEPDLNSTIVDINSPAEPEHIQEELQEIEDALEKILENDVSRPVIEDIIKINTDFGKDKQIYKSENFEELNVLNCPLVVNISCREPSQIEAVQVTFACSHPFYVSDSIICLEDLNGTEIIETSVFLANNVDISNPVLKILCTVTERSGKIVVLSQNVLIPLRLYANTEDVDNEFKYKLHVETNRRKSLVQIFKDIPVPDSNSVTFSYKNTKKTVKVTCDVVQANDFTEMYPILYYILKDITENVASEEIQVNIKSNSELIKNMLHKFLKCIEKHAKERISLKHLEDESKVLHSQFTLIQKKLFIKYGSHPPGNCDLLEFLMRDTHKSIVYNAECLIKSKDTVSSAACELSAVGYLILTVMKYSNVDDIKLKILEDTLSFETFHEDIQEWEEAVTQASTYILNNILKKTEKDKEKLAPVTDQDILSHTNIKRFIKQTRVIIEKMFLGTSIEHASDEVKEKVTRIEELVEVI